MRTTFQRILFVVLALGTTWIATTRVCAGEADDRFALAAGYYDRREWKLAAEEFLAFAEKHPNDPRANRSRFYLAEALLQSGKHADARRQFQNYIAREPAGEHAAAATFGAGEAAYLADDYTAAGPELSQFLQKYPNDPLVSLALPYLGNIALSKNDAKAAAEYFQAGLKRFPNGRLQNHSQLGLARALEKLNKLDEAEQLYKSLAEKPENPLADEAQFQLGALQYVAGQYDRAIENFAAFDKQFPKSPWRFNASLGRGLSLLKLNRPKEAIVLLDAVLAAESINPELMEQAQSGKIQAELLLKDYDSLDREVALFEKQFPKSGSLGNVRRMKARSLIERKRSAEAAVLLEAMTAAATAGRFAAPDIENRYLLAVSYEGQKRYEDALAALAPVVEHAKGALRADALSVQGSLLLGLKKYADAIKPIEEFLATKPAGDAAVRATGQLAICCARTSQIDRAKKLFAEMNEKHPGHPLLAPTSEQLAEAAFDANDTVWAAALSKKMAVAADQSEVGLKGMLNLAWTQYKAGQLTEAAVTFGELLEKNPSEAVAAEAAAMRGQILDELKQPQAALAMFNIVIEKYPQCKQRCDAMLASARLHEKLKRYEQAAAAYERIAKEYPKFARMDAVLYEWAWTLQESGKSAESKSLFERLRKEYPKSRYWADATYRLAQNAMDAKQFDAAMKLADEVLERAAAKNTVKPNPTPVGPTPVGPTAVGPTPAAGASSTVDPINAKVCQFTMYLRGQIFAAQCEWSKSREAFERLLLVYPETPRRLMAEYWVAESYYRENDLTAAADRFKRIAGQVRGRRDSWMAMVPLRRAQILALQNQWEDAYTTAVDIEADFPKFEQQYEVDYLLGRCLANRAEFDAARQAYNKTIQAPAAAKTETAAMAQWMIGESYFHQKNYEAAVRAYLQVEILYKYPTWQSVALLQAGKCRERLGDARQAAELYHKILNHYADTTAAKEAAKLLATLEKNPSKTPKVGNLEQRKN